MLHILWILIKFILIILGILLGLALLAVLLLLFCPVRYQARAVKETGSFKETELEARITWLFHVIGVRFCFHNGEGKLVVLFFGVSLETIKGWLKKLKGGRRKNSVSQTSRSKAKKRKKKSAQTKGISQENRTKKPDVKEASGEESNVSNAVAEEKTKQMAESRIELRRKHLSLKHMQQRIFKIMRQKLRRCCWKIIQQNRRQGSHQQRSRKKISNLLQSPA